MKRSNKTWYAVFTEKFLTSEGRQHCRGFLLMFRQPGFSSVLGLFPLQNSSCFSTKLSDSTAFYTCYIVTTFPSSSLSLSLSIQHSCTDLTAISPSSSGSLINSAQSSSFHSSKNSLSSLLKCSVTDYFLCLSMLILLLHKRIMKDFACLCCDVTFFHHVRTHRVSQFPVQYFIIHGGTGMAFI